MVFCYTLTLCLMTERVCKRNDITSMRLGCLSLPDVRQFTLFDVPLASSSAR